MYYDNQQRMTELSNLLLLLFQAHHYPDLKHKTCKSYAPTTDTQLLCHAVLFCSSPLLPQPGLLLLVSQGPLQTYNQEKKKQKQTSSHAYGFTAV